MPDGERILVENYESREYLYLYGGEWKMSEPHPMDDHVSRIPTHEITGKHLLMYSKEDNSLMIATNEDMTANENLELIDENIVLGAVK